MAEQHDESESSSGPDKPEPEATETEQTAQVEAEASESDADSPTQALAPIAPKKKKKKRALDEEPGPSRDRNRRLREEAAGGGPSKRRPQRQPTLQLEAGEIVDDAFARTSAAAGEWLKKNFAVLQWFILAGIIAWVGYAIYSYRAGRAAEQASAQLTTAIRAEGARVGPEETKPDPQTGIVETRAAYPTDEARLKAAEQQYRAVADSGSSTAASFAKLGLATVLYDQGKYAEAKVAYQAVKDSKLASQDMAVKGRALEGIGISLEGASDKEGARTAFEELAKVDGLGFNALGAYHQARLAFAAGNPEKAKELLKEAQKQIDASATPDTKELNKALGGGPTSYLQQSVKDLLRRVDPSAVPAPSAGGLTAEQLQELQQQMSSPGEDGSKGMSPEKLQELLKRMSKGAPSPRSPSPPASAP